MRVMNRNPWLTSLGTVLSLVGLWWGSAQAGVASTDQTASLIVFPKVIADGTRDTLIQIVNSSQFNMYEVHCAYANASGRCGSAVGTRVCTSDLDCPATEACTNITWQESDFSVQLTHQQPTIWRVSTGRNANIGQPTTPGQCTQVSPGSRQDCPGAFGPSDPDVLPTPAGFRGELRCYEVVFDNPTQTLGVNALKGEAILEADPDNAQGGPQISEYNAIGFRSMTQNPGDGVLRLDNVEYDVCPGQLQFTHYPVGADDIAARGFGAATTACPTAGDCPVDTELTVVPCTVDYGGPAPSVTVQVGHTDEFESAFISTPFDLTCFFNGSLSQLGASFNFTGPSLLKTRLIPATGGRCVGGPTPTAKCTIGDLSGPCGAGGTCRPGSGLLAVVEEFHTSAATPILGTAAFNVHGVGSRGTCTVSGNACTSDTQCAGGADLCASDSITQGELQ